MKVLNNNLEGWIPTKLIVMNFGYKGENGENGFYFPYEEFKFEDGKMMLIGTNGSGKSSVFQAFYPTILNGDLHPYTLFPQSSDRNISDYINGITYLFHEFKRKGKEEYCTVGIGLRSTSNKSSSIDKWYFALNDNRRIGKGFIPYKRDDKGNDHPLTKKEFKNKLFETENKNYYTEINKEYRKITNNLLFGYKDIKEYEKMLDIFRLLKQSLLNSNIKITKIEELIKQSLPKKNDNKDFVKYLNETEQNEKNLNSIKNEKDIIEEIGQAYQDYNESYIYNLANNLIDIFENSESRINKKEKKSNNIFKNKSKTENLNRRRKELKEEKITRRQILNQLQNHETKQLLDKINEIDNYLHEFKINIKNKNEIINTKEIIINSTKEKLDKTKKDIDENNVLLEEKINQLKEIADELDFNSHHFIIEKFFAKDSYSQNESEKKIKTIQNTINNIIKTLDSIKQQLKTKEKLNDKIESIQEQYQDKQDKCQSLLETIKMKEERLVCIKENFVSAIKQWDDNLDIALPLTKISHLISNYNGESEQLESQLKVIVKNIINEKVLSNNKGLNQIEHNNKLLNQEITEINNKIIKFSREEAKPYNDSRPFAILLNNHKIPNAPLYKIVDFKEETPKELRNQIEEFLFDTQLLNILVIPSQYKLKIADIIQESNFDSKDYSDKIIFTESCFDTRDTLLDYLTPLNIEELSINQIESVIAKISKNNAKGINFNSNIYNFASVEGHLSNQYENKYIGVTNRDKYKQKNIKKLRKEERKVKEEVSINNLEITKIEKEINVLKKTSKSIPAANKIETVVKEIINNKQELEITLKNLNYLEDKIEKSNIKLLEIDKVIEGEIKVVNNIKIKNTNVDYIGQILNNLNKYLDGTKELERIFNDNFKLDEDFKYVNDNFQSLNNDINALEEETGSLKDKVKNYQLQKNELEYQLSLSDDIKEIELKIRENNERLEQIDIDVEDISTNLGSTKAKVERWEKDIKKLEEQINLYEQAYDIESKRLDNLLEMDYIKKYIYQAKSKQNSINSAYLIKKELDVELDVISANERLIKTIEGSKNELEIYLINLPQEDKLEIDDRLKSLVLNYNYKFIVAYNLGENLGQKLSYSELYNQVKEKFEKENILNKENQNNFEKFFFKNVFEEFTKDLMLGDKVIEKVNKIVKNINTSSGLTYEIVKEINPKAEYDKSVLEIIENKGLNLIWQGTEVKDKLKAFFNQRLKEFKEERLTNNEISYEDFINGLFDYRNWFVYKIITSDKKLGTTSGSEGSIGKLIGLSCALYARYYGANEDCPKILLLDETFAGMDKKNPRVVLEILNELNFSFTLINPEEILEEHYEVLPAISRNYIEKPKGTIETILHSQIVWRRGEGNIQLEDTNLLEKLKGINIKEYEKSQQKEQTDKHRMLF